MFKRTRFGAVRRNFFDDEVEAIEEAKLQATRDKMENISKVAAAMQESQSEEDRKKVDDLVNKGMKWLTGTKTFAEKFEEEDFYLSELNNEAFEHGITVKAEINKELDLVETKSNEYFEVINQLIENEDLKKILKDLSMCSKVVQTLLDSFSENAEKFQLFRDYNIKKEAHLIHSVDSVPTVLIDKHDRDARNKFLKLGNFEFFTHFLKDKDKKILQEYNDGKFYSQDYMKKLVYSYEKQFIKSAKIIVFDDFNILPDEFNIKENIYLSSYTYHYDEETGFTRHQDNHSFRNKGCITKNELTKIDRVFYFDFKILGHFIMLKKAVPKYSYIVAASLNYVDEEYYLKHYYTSEDQEDISILADYKLTRKRRKLIITSPGNTEDEDEDMS